MSTIPGQMMDDNQEINIPLMLISLFGATLAFLLSLSWAAFLSDSVEAVQRKTRNTIPLPVARLLAALIVTAVTVTLLSLLFKWERKASATTAADEEEG
jgi:hypothetical protein